jgi:hypothetical protein
MENFVNALATAALEPGEERQLLRDARQVFGAPIGELRERLAAVRRHAGARRRREGGMRHREDRRPEMPAPAQDEELTPTLLLVDEILNNLDELTPPFRTLDHRLARVSRRRLSGLHQLVSEADDPLPAPIQATIKVADALDTSMIVEEYIRFVKRRRNGLEVNVRLPMPHLSEYASWEGSELPRVSGIATLPFVLPDRRLTSGHGLDRDLGLIFEVDPVLDDAVREIGPVSLADAQKAYTWLCENWLCDVATNAEGLAILIVLALTVIERHLLPERPAYFVAAAQRGSGKTTALNMISAAITGSMASAASWSFEEEEQRKAVFSYLREGAPMVVHDNIPRGSAISSSTIERALTSAELTDRVLGESRSETVPTATIITFTGNNISPKGDMASRSLVAHLSTNRPDPENREFVHEDPFAWTKAHRVEILRRLYTILMLVRAKPNKLKTRFKDWWSLIGHPVELVAGVDFEEIFRANDQFDEEAQGAADFLAMMNRYLEGEHDASACEFSAARVVKLCKSSIPWITGRSGRTGRMHPWHGRSYRSLSRSHLIAALQLGFPDTVVHVPTAAVLLLATPSPGTTPSLRCGIAEGAKIEIMTLNSNGWQGVALRAFSKVPKVVAVQLATTC